jgi:hypothetical protein
MLVRIERCDEVACVWDVDDITTDERGNLTLWTDKYHPNGHTERIMMAMYSGWTACVNIEQEKMYAGPWKGRHE